ncbi:NADPH:quinone reductase-like Zn-dependent oxidoreductase [Roseivirga ehrenbergii]|uniref:Alcohol dehydrogenase n=1 Tax=Roseivirga ehrenbergii (strain DSM 102268 / JCM 13514 / KCTC 12282 / NCIMB 14502 / KMM 6017) TaxID=279360 RepID=A0A150X0F3_ROSEK|nr:zinc-binding dehydrogenase [Roseivirga ehrenbergii]KYG72214.1 alcohol dehydrogenase [Roseivirga ehrenbergii]TCL13452.1 NADPH:quinone reductase-like Zn-dependent oxidoreductase [Roseivirga ehrenbergii]
MKALVLVDHPEDKVQLLEVEKPTPAEGKVLIKLKAAALNRRDQWIREGKYPNIQMNTILGSDGAGIVEEVGAGVSSDLIGNEVIINPNIDWGENPKVQSKAYHILGMPTNGTLAEYVEVEASKIHQKPVHLSWAEAASIPLGGLTAFRALFTQGQVAAGQNVLISGAGGGVAQFAMLYALAAQANVYVTSGSADKINTCIDLGAKAGFNYKTEDWQKEALQASGGFDVVIDSAGGDQINDFIKMMKPSGRIVFYGATNGTPQKLDMFRMFWNQITLQGSTMGNDQEFEQMVAFINKHKIKPILDSVRPFSEIISAFDAMKEGGTFGKLVIQFP